MAGPEPTLFVERIAGPDGVLLGSVRAVVMDAGLTATYEPDTSLAGSVDHPGGVTGIVRVKLAGGVSTPADGAVYRSSGSTATIGKTSGLSTLVIKNADGTGNAFALDTGALTATFANDVTLSAGALNVGALARADFGFAVGDEIADATAATTAATLTAGWLAYTSSADHALKAVSKDGVVVVLGGGRFPSGTGTASTSGTGTDVLATMPLADNHVAGVEIDIVARAPSPASIYRVKFVGVAEVESGSLNLGGTTVYASQTFGLAPTFNVSWSTGVLSVVGVGPSANVAHLADDGSGNTRVEIDRDVAGELIGRSVTLAGLTGTPGANGAQTVTAVPTSRRFVVAVPFVADTAGGATVELTTPPSIAWTASIRGLTAP